MTVDQGFLAEHNVRARVIQLLCEALGSEIPAPPAELRLDDGPGEGPDFHLLDEFYGLTLLAARGEVRPSANKIHKLIGGKTDRVFANVEQLKQKLPLAFKGSVPDDPALAAQQQFKNELLKVEHAQFRLEMDELERDHTHRLTSMTEAHERQVRTLENQLAEVQGQNAALKDLAEQQRLSIGGLQEQLKHEAVRTRDFEHVQLKVEELKAELADHKALTDKLITAHEKFETAANQRITEQKDAWGRAESRAQLAEQALRELQIGVEVHINEKTALADENATLRNQVEQSALQLEHEHAQQQMVEQLVEQIHHALTPMNQLQRMLESAATLNKQKAIDMDTLVTSMHDISTKLVNLPSELGNVLGQSGKQ